DAKGGLHAYNAIKEEIVRLTSSLAAGTLFNVVVFDSTQSRIDQFQPGLVAATPQNVERLRTWFDPINRDPRNLGVRRDSAKPTNVIDHPVGQMIADNSFYQNAQPRLTNVILEQNVDLVYIITSEWRGFSRLRREPNDREKADWERRRQTSAYRNQLARYEEEQPELRRKVAEAEARENAARAARGQPPRVWRHGWVHEKARHYGIEYTPNPEWQYQFFEEPRVVESYFRQFLQQEYREKNRPIPRFNIIMFLSENEEFSRDDQDRLRSFLRYFRNGRFRELRGLAAIESSRGG
ncbi:MAG: hypothetical protein EA353_00965, partial [Puniceicoccaceae bacterium]